MDVRSILEIKGAGVVTIAPEGTMSEAAQRLIANDIGAVVVTDGGGRLAGIISERDISRAVAADAGRLAERQVGELMKTRVVTCEVHASIIDVITLMNQNRIRHLPVMDGDELVGVVSMRDVSDVWQDAMEKEIERLQRSLDA
jgi:CBS domain-containing protein